MSDMDDAFEKLVGRQPSDKERQDLYRVRDALGIRNNDALWLILIALQHYQTHYETIPETIANTAKVILTEFKDTANATAKASLEETKSQLAASVAHTAKEIARTVSARQRIQWLTASVILITISLTGFLWFVHTQAYTAGSNQGYAMGYEKAKDEKASATWANTPEGQLAYQLAQTGSLRMLVSCSGMGWSIEKGICYPRTAQDGRIYGWRLPPPALPE